MGVEPKGSKPHSYGDSFSWSGLIKGSQNETVIRITDNIRAAAVVTIKFIIFPWALTKTKWLEVIYTILVLERLWASSVNGDIQE